MTRIAALLALSVVFACGAGDDDDATPDAAGTIDASDIDGSSLPDAAAIDGAPADAGLFPANLAEAGLYSDFGAETLAPGVMEFEPQFILWSDAATKKRWVLLPVGTMIDTTDMNNWDMPIGTKFFKEFTRGGTRVETRMLWKQPDGDWYPIAFEWNAAQTEALAVPSGQDNANGTLHDIPSQDDCDNCHGRQPDYPLGFTAIQLDHTNLIGGVNLDTLITSSLLTTNPVGTLPYFPVPGDATEKPALGYLHANCGDCHHDLTNLNSIDVRFRLDVTKLASVDATPAFLTAVGVTPMLNLANVTSIIEPGDVDASAVHVRMNSRAFGIQMPPIGSEDVDTVGLAAIDAWINSL